MFFGGFLFYNSIVFKISSGFWVYLLTLFLLFFFGFFLFVRFKNPIIVTDDLFSLSSEFAVSQNNPCSLHIIGGIPNSPSPDGNIQVNVLCPNGQTSPNYIKFSAVSNHTAINALKIISSVNNFTFKLNEQNEIEEMGSIKNTLKQKWYFYLNSSQISKPLDKIIINTGDVLDFKYE